MCKASGYPTIRLFFAYLAPIDKMVGDQSK
jgi:hypothetical protein